MSTSAMEVSFTPAHNAIATFIFAHGAGADMDSEFIAQISQALVALRVNVLRFNFSYMSARKVDGKRRPPSRMPTLIEEYKQVLAGCDPALPIFIGGKSMGSRVAVHLSEQADVAGVMCLGYPFHPQKKPENLRLDCLFNTNKPVLIVQGTRDPLGNEQEIKDYQLPAHIKLAFLQDGDHDLKPRVKSGYTHQQHKQRAVEQMFAFIKVHLNG
ncbi:alpha/beta family hydrolase [Thalassotalea aquiviva]|uniref:alpha/beta family hydrolase n=1 Tax=Thalassotalea aquiviva TaxID=3242415 RepID=UPI00352BAC6C